MCRKEIYVKDEENLQQQQQQQQDLLVDTYTYVLSRQTVNLTKRIYFTPLSCL